MTGVAAALRPWLVLLSTAALASCTAARVLTHSTNNDPLAVRPGAYRLDPHHWSVVFDVDHLGFSRFVMRFDRVTADLNFAAEAPERSQMTAVIDAASVDTNDPELDDMVRGPNMFDVNRYPEIRYQATGLQRTGTATGTMTGTLTIHDHSQPVTLQVTFNGGAPNPVTREYTLGFSATGTFNRSDFGLSTWYPAVGEDVRVSIQAEFVSVQ